MGGVMFNRQVPRDYTLKPQRVAIICDLCIPKVEKLPFDPYVYNPNETTFKPNYRVWGRVYVGIEMPTLTAGPPVFIYIDRMETIE